MSKKILSLALLAAFFAVPAQAQQASPGISPYVMNSLFILFCGVLVMWMTAGFAMLEAGFVREKNVVTQCAKNIGLFAIASTAFVLSGYGIMFPNGSWILPGILGSNGAIEIEGVVDAGSNFIGRGHAGAGDIFFQSMFCVAVASIVSGTIAERVKLAPFFIFTAALTAFIYPIQASWTWGGGFLASELGFKDLAGSTVVHVVGGVAALTGALFLGARQGRFVDGKRMPLGNYSLPLATVGALILGRVKVRKRGEKFGSLSPHGGNEHSLPEAVIAFHSCTAIALCDFMVNKSLLLPDLSSFKPEAPVLTTSAGGVLAHRRE